MSIWGDIKNAFIGTGDPAEPTKVEHDLSTPEGVAAAAEEKKLEEVRWIRQQQDNLEKQLSQVRQQNAAREQERLKAQHVEEVTVKREEMAKKQEDDIALQRSQTKMENKGLGGG